MSDGSEIPDPFSAPQAEKRARLLSELSALTAHHHRHCRPYRNMIDALHPAWREADTLEALPWLPVGVFKRLRLSSVPDAEVFRELRSSGTSGSSPSRVLLDRATAARQTRALAAILGHVIGRERRPMLVIDRNDLLRSGEALSARGAAVLGFGNFGRQLTYALRPDLTLDIDTVKAFLSRFGEEPIRVFGFTFMVWQHFINALKQQDIQLTFPEGSLLLHGGGWKRLAERKIDSAMFKQAIAETLGIRSVHDYYGMAEQVGSIFVECNAGRLHTPAYAEAIVRHPVSLSPLPIGQQGVIQLISELPGSYPGHSLLTEDIGAITGEDDCPCGRLGRTLRVDGRLPRAELRGCSDTRSV